MHKEGNDHIACWRGRPRPNKKSDYGVCTQRGSQLKIGGSRDTTLMTFGVCVVHGRCDLRFEWLCRRGPFRGHGEHLHCGPIALHRYGWLTTGGKALTRSMDSSVVGRTIRSFTEVLRFSTL